MSDPTNSSNLKAVLLMKHAHKQFSTLEKIGKDSQGKMTYDGSVVALVSDLSAAGPVIDDVTPATTAVYSSDKVVNLLANKSATNHNHSGLYEPIIATKNTGFNLTVGTTAGTVSAGDHNHDGDYIAAGANFDASRITSGTIDISRIPAAALERMVTVTDQTARYALTTDTVQLGDTVRQTSDGSLWMVIDEGNLGNASGYQTYTASTASAVAWTGVSDKPAAVTNLSGTNTGDNAVNSNYSGLVTNATHTGDVTGNAALTIAAGAVTLAKMANMATGSLIYRKTAGTGVPEVQTLATLKTDLGLVTNATHTGEVTGDGYLTIVSNAVTFAKMQDVATGTIFYRKTAGSGDPEVQTLATLKTDLALTGTNSGDETGTSLGLLLTSIPNKATLADTDEFAMRNATTGILNAVSYSDLKANISAASEVTLASSATLTAANLKGTVINNYGQSAAVAGTLPTIEAGMNFIVTISTTNANAWKLTCPAASKFILNGVAGTVGQSLIVTPTQGNYVTCLAVRTGASTYDLIATTGFGTWTLGA